VSTCAPPYARAQYSAWMMPTRSFGSFLSCSFTGAFRSGSTCLGRPGKTDIHNPRGGQLALRRTAQALPCRRNPKGRPRIPEQDSRRFGQNALVGYQRRDPTLWIDGQVFWATLEQLDQTHSPSC
jgi:hypothetical protein